MANKTQSPPTKTKIMMNKEEAHKRLAAIESEALELRAMINKPEQPEQPEPKQGEVWKDVSGAPMLVTDDGHCYLAGPVAGDSYGFGPIDHGYRATRLGTFEEVFVERSKVREVVNEVLDDEDAWADKNDGCLYTPAAFNARRKLTTLL